MSAMMAVVVPKRLQGPFLYITIIKLRFASLRPIRLTFAIFQPIRMF